LTFTSSLERHRPPLAAVLVIALRKQDQASSVMIERCQRQIAAPSGEDWDDTAIALTK
jgi:hypothetical protein